MIDCPHCDRIQLIKWGAKELTPNAKVKLRKKYGIKFEE